jgi:hypothetical protein
MNEFLVNERCGLVGDGATDLAEHLSTTRPNPAVSRWSAVVSTGITAYTVGLKNVLPIARPAVPTVISPRRRGCRYAWRNR